MGLSSLPPAGLPANQDWPVDITVLQHGQTPLAGVTPIVRVRDDGGKVVKSFTATPTGKTGVYHAVVRFPAEGSYSYEVYDGFTHVRRRADAHVQADRDRRRRRRLPVRAPGRSLSALAVALAAATTLALRRRRPDPEPIQLREAA